MVPFPLLRHPRANYVRRGLLVAFVATCGCASTTPPREPKAPAAEAPPPAAAPATAPAAASDAPELAAEDRSLASRVESLAREASPSQRSELASRLLALANQVIASRWLEERRERVARANAAAGLSPTPEQFLAQMQAWQTEHLERVLSAMVYVATPDMGTFALAVASDESAPFRRRESALELLDRISSVLDESALRAREAVRQQLARLSAERDRPGSVTHGVAAMRLGFRRCYQEQLGRTPGVAYSGTVQFTLDASGRVVKTDVLGLTNEMVPCIAAVVAASAFAASGEQQVIKVPVAFTPMPKE